MHNSTMYKASVYKGNGIYLNGSLSVKDDHWIKSGIPTDYIITNDGVKAIPSNISSIANDVVQIKPISYFVTDNSGIANDVIDIQEVA